MSFLEPVKSPEMRSNEDARSKEAKFDIEEIFFSRTDERGVIAAGNEVFRRISEYEWDEITGAPHKIIRHADMPKGVFQLFWERIQAGRPVGAYVKNRSKSGSYYWVYAIVSPIEGGFLSVRLKPSSDLFSHVPDLYAKLLAEEENDNLTPEQSAASLRGHLKEMGFESYGAFSARAICDEVLARDQHMGRRDDSRLAVLQKVLPILEDLSGGQDALVNAFAGIKGIPSNMRIVASRLEPAGGPISAISQNYRLMSDEVTGEIDGLQKALGDPARGASIAGRVLETVFVVAASRLMRETRELFKAEVEGADSDSTKFKGEATHLQNLVEQYSTQAADSLSTVSGDMERMSRSVNDLRQLVTGLDSIRVLCRVEAGRLGAGSAALLPVIDQLDRSHVKIDKTLEKILDISGRLADMAKLAMPRNLNGKI